MAKPEAAPDYKDIVDGLRKSFNSGKVHPCITSLLLRFEMPGVCDFRPRGSTGVSGSSTRCRGLSVRFAAMHSSGGRVYVSSRIAFIFVIRGSLS